MKGDLRELLQATLSRLHAGRWFDSRYSKHFLPAVQPIVSQEGLGSIASAYVLEPLRLSFKAPKRVHDIGTIRRNPYNNVLPRKGPAESLAIWSLPDQHRSGGHTLVV